MRIRHHIPQRSHWLPVQALLACALALLLCATHAYADEDDAAAASDVASGVAIVDVGIFETQTNQDAFAFASDGQAGYAEITARGGQIDFDAAVYWNDGKSVDYNYTAVTWESDNPAVASVAPGGVVTARSDGTATITCTVDAALTADGQPVVARVAVVVAGQADSRFVASIAICDDTGTVIDPSYVFEGQTLAVAMIDLQARVLVRDPAGGPDQEYLVTPKAGLAAQAPDLPDLVWSVSESKLGSISDTGTYRPSALASNMVYCMSTAGFAGSVVSDDATIIMPGVGDDAHPQETLTIDVAWEEYPDTIVKSVTFSLGELEDMGTQTRSYTAIGGGTYGFYSYTGRGPYLAQVLEAAGVDITGVKQLSFGTYDSVSTVVSWNLLFGPERFYFPNMDIGSFSEGEPVPAMVAIDSGTAPIGQSAPLADIDDSTRFRLLFGSRDDGQSVSQYQIKWIHTIHVLLTGAPPAQPIDPGAPASDEGGEAGAGDDEPEQVPDVPDKEPDDQQDPRAGDDGSASDERRDESGATAPAGADPPASGNQGQASAVDASTLSFGLVQDVPDDAPADDAVTEDVPSDELDEQAGEGPFSRWSVLQAISKNTSDVDDIFVDNPFAPFAAPAGAAMVLAGALTTLLGYRRQKRTPGHLAP